MRRLPRELQIGLLETLLPAQSGLENLLGKDAALTMETQFAIPVAQTKKRPDLVVFLEGKPLIVIEVKVGAAEQQHRIHADDSEEQERQIIQGQLETYSQWIAGHASAKWPGAVVLLTHDTKASPEFDNSNLQSGKPLGSVRTWRDVGLWLRSNATGDDQVTYSALASELVDFLWENSLMTNYFSSRDLAAAELYVASHQPLIHTFWHLGKALSDKFPSLRGGQYHTEINSELGVIWNWFYTNRQFNIPGCRLYISVGICFCDVGSFGGDDPDKLPQHENYLFMLFADDNYKTKSLDILNGIPDGWTLLADEVELISTMPISKLSPDPDARFTESKTWAEDRVASLVARVKNFASAPVEKIPEEEEEAK